MKTHPAPLPPPPVKRLAPILPSMTDTTLMNKQKVLNIIYTQIQGIVHHARLVNGTRVFMRNVRHGIAMLELLPNMSFVVM